MSGEINFYMPGAGLMTGGILATTFYSTVVSLNVPIQTEQVQSTQSELYKIISSPIHFDNKHIRWLGASEIELLSSGTDLLAIDNYDKTVGILNKLRLNSRNTVRLTDSEKALIYILREATVSKQIENALLRNDIALDEHRIVGVKSLWFSKSMDPFTQEGYHQAVMCMNSLGKYDLRTQKVDSHLNPEGKRAYMRQLLAEFAEISKQLRIAQVELGMIHRDIKPSNILFQDEHSNSATPPSPKIRLTLADLGSSILSSRTPFDITAYTGRNTLQYAAFEMLASIMTNANEFSHDANLFNSDQFSLAMTLLDALTSYSQLNDDQIIDFKKIIITRQMEDMLTVSEKIETKKVSRDNPAVEGLFTYIYRVIMDSQVPEFNSENLAYYLIEIFDISIDNATRIVSIFSAMLEKNPNDRLLDGKRAEPIEFYRELSRLFTK